MTVIELRPYQRDALGAVGSAELRGVRRQLVVLPTGSGKTVVFSRLIYENRPGRAVVLVHRDELVHQTVRTMAMVAPELTVGVVKAGLDQVGADVVVASVQTVANPRRLERLGAFRTVVVDEAHHAPSPTWRRVLEGLGSFAHDPDGPLTIGFTATPERSDGALGIWEEIVAYRTIREMIYDGYLAPVTGQRVDTQADFSKIRKTEGDLSAGQLGDELERSGAIDEIADAVVKYAADRKGVAFTPTVATAQALAKALTYSGVAAEAVWGAMDRDERRAVLHRLKTGETRYVTNCAVLTEGFDEASVDCIVIARPTTSHGLYVQMVGRGTRKHPGKADCLVLDVVGATERHDLVGVVDLGLEAPPAHRSRKVGEGQPVANPCALCGRELPESTVAAGQTRHKTCRAGGTGRADVFAASKLRWLEVDGGFCLPTDKGALVLAPLPGGEELWQLADYTGGKITVLHHSLPIDWAQGIGEDRAKAFGKLSQRSASWLQLPPTDAQLARLVREGLPQGRVSAVTSRGQAADLITRLQGRRALRRLAAAR